METHRRHNAAAFRRVFASVGTIVEPVSRGKGKRTELAVGHNQ